MIAIICAILLSLHYGAGWWTLLIVVMCIDVMLTAYRGRGML